MFLFHCSVLWLQVNVLRGEADNIELEMEETRAEIEHQEKEVSRMRAHLKRMSTKDSLYVRTRIFLHV